MLGRLVNKLSSPLYSFSPPHDWHFIAVTISPHSLHTNLPTPAGRMEPFEPEDRCVACYGSFRR